MRERIRLILLFAFLGFAVLPNFSFATDINACQTLSTSDFYNLTADASSAGTCFTIAAANITLECNNHQVTYGNTLATQGNGVYNNGYDNVTIQNCNFRQGAGTINKMGVYIGNAQNNSILNSNVTSTSGYGVVISLGSNNFINNSVVNSWQTHGIYLNDTSYNNISFTNLSVGNGNGDYGIYVYNDSTYNWIYADLVSSATDNGIRIEGVSSGSNYNNVSNNTFRTTAGTTSAVYVYYGSNNYVLNNIVTSTATGGIYLTQYSSDNNVSYNNVTAGNGASDYGIQLDNSANNNFFLGNTVGATGSAVEFTATASSGNNFTNNLFNSTQEHGMYLLSGDSVYVADNSIETGATAAAFYGIYMDSVTNSIIQENYIRQRSATAGYGIYIYRSSNGNTIYNNTINVSAGQGIALTTTVNTNNMTLNFINATTAGINFAATAISNTADSNNITVFNGYAFSFTSSSNNNNIWNNIAGEQTYGATITSSTGMNFTNNTFNSRANIAVNLAAGASNNYFGNNTFLAGNGGGGYVVTATSDSGNTFRNNIMTSYYGTAVYLQTSVSSFLFDNNNITTNATNVQAVSLTTSAYWNNFTNNNITSWTSYAVLLQTDSSNNSFINNTIFSNSSVGVGILGGSTYNIFDHNVIQSGVNANAYGVYIDTSDYNNVTNSNVSSRAKSGATGAHALYIANGNAKFNWFENDTFFTNSTTAYGIYMITNVYNNTFKNVTAISNNSFGVRLSTSARNNTFNVCNITSYQSYVGYFDTTTSTNNSFANCYFNNYYTLTTQTVLYFSQASGNTFRNVSINAAPNTNSRGIWFTGATGIGADNNRFYNSTITAAGTTGYDVYSDIDSDNYFLNVSYNTLDAYFNDALSSLNLSWYLNTSVKDQNGNLLPYANVTIVDNNGYLWFNGATNAFGLLTPFGAVQYLQTCNSCTNSSTPYNITAFKGSAWGTTTQALTDNANPVVTLTVSSCGTLTTNTTLSNDVYAAGTCFTANADYLTLDCAGYAINFSRTATGYGVNATSRNNVTINNCTFFQGAATNGSYAVLLSNSQNTTIANSTFTTINATHFYLSSSNDTVSQSNSFNSSRVTVTSSSQLYVKWFSDVIVKDYSNNGVESANVTFYNTTGSQVASALTNSSGSIPTQPLIEYIQRDSGSTYQTNYTINVTFGNVSNSTALNITANAYNTMQLNVTTCGTLNSDYTLTNNVQSSGTCFVVNASSVTLNCNGYTVNYSRSSAGFGVNDTSESSFTAKNCNFVRGGTDASSYAVLFNMSNTGVVANSTITSGNATGVFLSNAHNAAVINTTITVSGGTQQVNMDSTSSNASRWWFANVHVIGLANEDIPSATINVTNYQDTSEANATADASGYRSIMVRESQVDYGTTTYYAPLNYSATSPVTFQQNSTTDNTTSSKNITVQVVSAEINVTTPLSNTVYLQGQTVNITINETKGSSWITNVTVYIYNDDLNLVYQATQTGDNWWEYDYDIDPGMTSRTIYITAYGMNGSTNVTATSQFIVTHSSGGTVPEPSILSFCSNQTYALVNNSVSVNTSAQLGTVLYSITANVTYPNATTNTLTRSGSVTGNESDYVYSALFNFTLPVAGDYDIATSARDVNDHVASTTNRITAVSSSNSVDFNASGADYVTILDLCSPTSIANGSMATGGAPATISASIPAGLYRVLAVTSKPAITFGNVSLNSTVTNTTFINYAELSSGSYNPPANRRIVTIFNITGNNVNYTTSETFYNYTEKESLLIAEASLEFQKCEASSCTWAVIPYGLNTTTNNITGYANTTPTGVWAVMEPSSSTTNTVTNTINNYITGSVTVNVPYNVTQEKIIEKITSRHLFKAPQQIEVYQSGTASVSIGVVNDGSTAYKDVQLSAKTPLTQMSARLSPQSIATLAAGSESTSTLTIDTKNAAVGSYYVTVTGVTGDFSDSILVPVKVVEFKEADRLEAERQLSFAQDLIKQNQECLEFTDTLKRAKAALDKGDITTALKLENEAIEGCKRSLSLLRKEVSPLTGLFGAGFFQGDLTTSAVIGATGIIIGLTLVLLKRLTSPKRKDNELGSQLEGSSEPKQPEGKPPEGPGWGGSGGNAFGSEEVKREGV